MTSPFKSSNRIGESFVQSQRLTPAEVEQIALKQQTDNLRFGEAAMALGLLTENEVQQALSNQYQYATADSDPALSAYAIAYAPRSPEAEAIRKLRTQILLQLDATRLQSIAIVGPSGGEGKSYVAASLALAMAQNGQRTLLINANLRTAQQSGLMDSQRQLGLSSVLSGRYPIDRCLATPNFPRLSILDAGPLPPNPAELLQSPALRNIMLQLSHRFDMVIVDTPPAKRFPDAQLIAQQVNACIMVARQHKTLISDIRKTKRMLQAAGGTLLGSIYNTQAGDDHAPASAWSAAGRLFGKWRLWPRRR